MQLKLNASQLEELLRDFYTLTSIRIVVFDTDFNEVVCYPQALCDFCRRVRGDPACLARCARSDRQAFERCRQTGKICIYRCFAGLTEAAAPILSDGELIGYVMFGQIIDVPAQGDKKTAAEAEAKSWSDFSLDREALKTDYGRLTSKTPEQIGAAAKIMEACACYLWLSNLVSVRQEQVIGRLEKYVEANLDADLRVETLCAALSVRRSRLYALVRQYYGAGIADYVRRARMRQACRLLTKTALPVAEIGALVGMDDYNYFSKVFRRETGMSPRAYRKAEAGR
jgi:AraC-like DNA-binding protein/ligand-binding sensor protein